MIPVAPDVETAHLAWRRGVLDALWVIKIDALMDDSGLAQALERVSEILENLLNRGET